MYNILPIELLSESFFDNLTPEAKLTMENVKPHSNELNVIVYQYNIDDNANVNVNTFKDKKVEAEKYAAFILNWLVQRDLIENFVICPPMFSPYLRTIFLYVISKNTCEDLQDLYAAMREA